MSLLALVTASLLGSFREPTVAQGASDTIEVRLKLRAIVEGKKFTGVTIHKADLEGLEVQPGDRVTVKREGGDTRAVERWSQVYIWNKKEKKGKKTVNLETKQPVQPTWRVTWGKELAGTLHLGDLSFDFEKEEKPRTVHRYVGPKVDGDRSLLAVPKIVLGSVDRKTERPANAPADAKTGKLTVTPLVKNDQIIGELVVTIDPATR